MYAKKIHLAFWFAVITAVSTLTLQAQTSEGEQLAAAQSGGFLDTLERIREAQSQRFEGSWDIVVTPVVPPGAPSFVGHATVSRGGGYFGSDRARPFSKQHGAWEHLGGSNFAYTLKEDLFDAMGNFDGTVVVRARLTLNDKDAFTGVANAENRDAGGNVRFNRCTTVRGARIRVEALSEQCQSITPPQ